MPWTPHTTVAAIAEYSGRFLLAEEMVAGKPVYNQPAGHLEPNESLIEAVIRETLEETLFRFVPPHWFGVYQFQQAESRETYIRIAFAGHFEGEQQGGNLSDGIFRAQWLN